MRNTAEATGGVQGRVSVNGQRFLTGKQLRQRYGDVSRMTIYRWTKDGKLPPPVRIGSHPMWRLSDLEAQEARQ